MSETKMKRISELQDLVFDGVTNPYVPPAALKISDTLKLHSEFGSD